METNQKDTINWITERIIGAAIDVHKQLGPGLLESAYEECLNYELIGQGLSTARQQPLPVVYKEIKLDCGYRIDLIVEDRVIVELKAVERLLPVHEAQLLTYLKLLDRRAGLLINFNVSLLRQGIRRVVNNFSERSAAEVKVNIN